MKGLIALLRAHPYFSSYLLVYGLLQIGLIQSTGLQYAPALFFLFFVPFCLFYSLTNLLPEFRITMGSARLNTSKLEWLLLGMGLVIVLIHLIWLGKIPLIEAWQATKLSAANLIRKNSSAGLPSWLRYASTWTVRAIFPAATLLFLSKKNDVWFIISLLLGSFYGLALLQKSLVLWTTIPVLVYFILNKKWIATLVLSATIGMLFVLAVYANNPQLHGGEHDLKIIQNKTSKTSQVSEGIVKRIFLVPGKTLGLWFEHVPKDKPFLFGQDFGPFARLQGLPTKDYNLELYPLFYPEYAKQGIRGSVNAAHFMRSYANFGWWGLTLSALMMAIFFWLLNNIHRKTQSELAFSLQIFPLFLLSSGSLLTLLFSGGWGLIILLLLLRQNP
ncbi:MAG: hypothetical protein ACKOWM_07505 [Sphingomonadales bacterium]